MTTAAKLAQIGSPGVSTGFKNRIINGAMIIDQRNAGASVNPTDGQYILDRWFIQRSQASKLTAQQNAGSVTPPVGFTNYLGITSSSSYSVISSDYFTVQQRIEGFNASDLGWGTANAKTITFSFWVRSSLTGTFGGALLNSGASRSYPFTYTISSANTWEQKSVTVAGDTSGTWLTNNGIGVDICFGLGVGSNNSATAGSWSSGGYNSATGATSVVGTNGATWYITGVQLEVGTTATEFEYVDYGRQLQQCQRYYEKSYNIDTAIGSSTTEGNTFSVGRVSSATVIDYCTTVKYAVPKRSSPSLSFWLTGGAANLWATTAADKLPSFNAANTISFSPYFSGLSGLTSGDAGYGYGHWAASAEL